jgi:very-short-patch-repair endonuclease
MQKHFPQYSRRLVSNARRLRREMTDAERKLWLVLRGNPLGIKFRRQVPFGKHVLDFYCHEAKLNIEVDGSQHYTEEGRHKDGLRDAGLRKQGIDVMRFSDRDVLTNIAGVGEVIQEKLKPFLKDETSSRPSPERRRGLVPVRR